MALGCMSRCGTPFRIHPGSNPVALAAHCNFDEGSEGRSRKSVTEKTHVVVEEVPEDSCFMSRSKQSSIPVPVSKSSCEAGLLWPDLDFDVRARFLRLEHLNKSDTHTANRLFYDPYLSVRRCRCCSTMRPTASDGAMPSTCVPHTCP